ncbi:MAG: DUF3302 domain-containing protein [gamma proteobacterium symbiont of Ctena orbiculata]|nr:DUF3302 domain-containing protein [Candidatus Thiodiazotropha taylori]MBT3059611.1 DUF3302 domain-containing protein [Candidatus Thiodiazotropha sp. (ex Lucina pensylvanica)]MBV2093728.1 DUF3302 domain-containing protein [Candidatus Thiodiazotropha sp. (ex Codakia orbicularis)]PUB72135.1 MAG: hypothetical protein DBP03_18405 [gamma proteobacterium symbiont of Ctena orbiculata]MBT3063208.1 DUF3302 domain-containing protein [Candidatus Thiodiazotropha sp. (ex Lucina pensylvanica)]
MFLDYFALFLVFFVVLFFFYAIIVIHDIPYEIARHRNHPHQDAIHVAGWVSLFTLHAIWPFLWIWSTLYREDRGWGFNNNGIRETDGSENTEMAALRQQLEVLSERVETLSNRHHQTSKSEQEG